MPDAVLYLYPTPAGAYHAVTGDAAEATRAWLLRLMAGAASPPCNDETLARLGERRTFQQLRRLRLLQGCRQPGQVGLRPLELELPGLLATLAGPRRSLLVDDQGFHLAGHGFASGQAEELAGLAASLCELRRRYQGLLGERLGYRQAAWALVGAGGYSHLGFWPMCVGRQCFVLVLDGRPNLNQQALVELIWRLVHRYGASQREVTIVSRGGSSTFVRAVPAPARKK